MRADVVVVGGGLAGATAALDLAAAGAAVTLLESRPRLGGAAHSFARGPLTIDNGQHVFLRCCTAYRELLDRIGATGLVRLQPRLAIPVLDLAGPTGWLRRAALPAPAHLLPALLGYRLLTPAERLRAARGAAAVRRLDPDDPALDATTFGAFLRAHGQTDRTIAALWAVIGTATLNRPPDDASLALAARVVHTGLLDEPGAADVGFARVPLDRIHHDAVGAALAAAGVTVRLRTRVTALAAAPGGHPTGFTLRLRAGAGGPADAVAGGVVLAVPHPVAGRLLAGIDPAGAQPLAGLGSSPIVNVHVVFDRVVTDHPFAAVVGSPAQWLFDRTAAAGVPNGQYLAITISAADDVVDVPAATLTERLVAELRRLLPAARGAGVVDAFVTRERQATFRQAPGSAALRPPATTALPRLALAGAWTATGWPDTMESAVRSGHAAARVLTGPTRAAGPARAVGAASPAGPVARAGEDRPAARAVAGSAAGAAG